MPTTKVTSSSSNTNDPPHPPQHVSLDSNSQQSFRHAAPHNPTGFQLNGAAKESHECPIYCVAWSPHIHEIESVVDSSQKAKERSNEFISYFATCGGPHATIYEVVTSLDHGKNSNENGSINKTRNGNSSSHNRQPPTVRQVYRDIDDGENFYTCAFGGRGVGSPVGCSPLGAVVTDKAENENGATGKHCPKRNDSIHHSKIIYFGDKNQQGTAADTDDTSALPPSKRQRMKENQKQSQSPQHPFLLPYSTNTQDGPPLLCLAGVRGVIKVIDTHRRCLFMTLSGHGDEVTDMKFSPTNEWLLLTSSKDESVRLWNLQRGVNVAVFTGHDGHRGQVLSVDWHCSGNRFVSGGMDNVIKLWNVFDDIEEGKDAEGQKGKYDNGGDDVLAALENSFNVTPDVWPVETKDGNQNAKPTPEARQNPSTKFRTVYKQTPYFSTNKVHTDYVDCVQFVGDLILSKSVHNVVVLWKPLLGHEHNEHIHHTKLIDNKNTQNVHRVPSSILFLREFTLNHCNSWFVRFHSASPHHRLLALGNQVGEIKVWEIGGSDDDNRGFHPHRKYFCNLTTLGSGCFNGSGGNGGGGNGNGAGGGAGGSTVRMVAFSPFGSSLVAVCDDSTVWKWDAVY